MHYEAPFAFDNVLRSIYETIETYCPKTISQASVMHSLNSIKLSSLQNVGDLSSKYLACKIQTENTVPYLHWQDPECFSALEGIFSACTQGQLAGMCWDV